MAERAVDAIVIGGGVMGCATAWRLAMEGARVTLLEQFPLGHGNASSHGPSRMIRLAYAELEYVHLGRQAWRLWDELIAETGIELLRRTGGLDVGAPDALAMDEVALTYETLGMPYQRLDRGELRRLYPQLNLPEGSIGLYQEDYGILAASRCVTTLASQARSAGADLRDNELVTGIAPNGGGVEVLTTRGTYRAGRAIVTAGSWIAPLLAPLGIDLPLTVLQEQLAFFQVRDPEAHRPDRLPLIIHRFPGTTSLGSVFPIYDHQGIKVMLDRLGPAADPSNPDRAIDPVLLERLRAYATEILPGVTGEILETTSCRYTMTADEDFIIDRHPEHGQIVFASPCSGHGFKFAPVIGQMLADLALRGETAFPTARFRYTRPALEAAWRREVAA